MSNVYKDGKTDERQGGDIQPSLFRPRYKALEKAEVELHDQIKAKAQELAEMIVSIDTTPTPVREGDILDGLRANRHANIVLSIRHLEDSVYRAVKALTT